MQMYDIHTHILPGMDDGAQDVDVACLMLESEARQGAEIVALTPHYYGQKRNIEEFLKQRESAFSGLVNEIEKRKLKSPVLVQGAEVYLTRNLALSEDLNKLCIQGTNTILIELPFEKWGNWVLREIERMVYSRDLKVVLAHPERYVMMPWDIKKLKPFSDMGAVFQINAETVLKRKGLVHKFLNSDFVCILASDAHNTKTRGSKIESAARRLFERYGKDFVDGMQNYAKNLMTN